MPFNASNRAHSSRALPTIPGIPRHPWVEAALIVAFWLGIFMLTAGRRAIDPRGPGGPGFISGPEIMQAAIVHGVWLFLTPGIFWLSARYSLDRENWIQYLFLHVGVAMTVAIIMNLFNFYTFRTLVLDQTGFYRGRFPWPFSLTGSIASLRFLDELIIYFVVLSAGFARDYFRRYQHRLQETAQLRAQSAELEAQLAEARLHALRMQINPHFLFNTLHAVSSLVDRDPEGVQRMIARLSTLLRYALETSSSQEVPLSEELDFLKDYLEIQRIRFDEHLDIHVQITEEVKDALVPSLILQPLVENAIKHGASKADKKGRVEIHGWREGEQLKLAVEDNGPGIEQTDGEYGDGSSDEGVGLRNTRERLHNLYGGAQRLELTSGRLGGTGAIITLPYHTTTDLRATSPSPATKDERL